MPAIIIIVALILYGYFSGEGNSEISEAENEINANLTLQEYVKCNNETISCYTPWGAFISSSKDFDKLSNAHANFSKQISTLHDAFNYLSSTKSKIKRSDLVQGRDILKNYTGKLFCTKDVEATLYAGHSYSKYYFTAEDGVNGLKNNKCLNELFLEINPIRVDDLNCIFSSASDSCYLQWISNFNQKDERLNSYKILLPKGIDFDNLYDGDLISITGEIDVLSYADEGLKFSSLLKLEKKEEIIAVNYECFSGGCNATKPSRVSPTIASDEVRFVLSALNSGGRISGYHFHYELFENSNFSMEAKQRKNYLFSL